MIITYFDPTFPFMVWCTFYAIFSNCYKLVVSVASFTLVSQKHQRIFFANRNISFAIEPSQFSTNFNGQCDYHTRNSTLVRSSLKLSNTIKTNTKSDAALPKFDGMYLRREVRLKSMRI